METGQEMKDRCYLDYNATAPLKDEVISSMEKAFTIYGNPSSIHYEGRTARGLMEDSRDVIASTLSVTSDRLIFTSGGTESNNLAIKSSIKNKNIKKIFVSPTEHPSVLDVIKSSGVNFQIIKVDQNGVVDLKHLASSLEENENSLVSVMYANNETGVIQPIEKIVEIAKLTNSIVHCDGVQALGKLDFNIDNMGLDFITFSGHKVGGPKGIGLLVIGKNADIYAENLGGGQEMGRRSGTENFLGIIGLATAIEACTKDLKRISETKALRDFLEKSALSISPDSIVHGFAADRLPNTLSISMPMIESAVQLVAFDLKGISISSGSACSSGKVEESHVLKAMNVNANHSRCSIRVSIGSNTTKDEILRFLEVWSELKQKQLYEYANLSEGSIINVASN